MNKIIQRTRRFEKSFGKLNVKTQKLFIKKLGIFVDDEYSPSLRTHKLKGKHQNEYAFSITDDIRAIYEKHSEEEKEILIFKFVKNGKEIGIFLSKEEFEDFIEEQLPLQESFRKELYKRIKSSKKQKGIPLKAIL